MIRRLLKLVSLHHQPGATQAAVPASYPEKADALDIENEMREFAAQTAQRANAFGRW